MGYATSIVCANAFLPGLAREDPEVVAARPGQYSPLEDGEVEGAGGIEGQGEEGRALLSAVESGVQAISTADLTRQDPSTTLESNGDSAHSHYTALLSLTTSRISSTGTALGFFSGVTVLGLLIVPVTLGEGSTASLRLAIGLSGLWWAVFTIPCWIGLPGGEKGEASQSGKGGWVGRALGRVGKMVSPREMKRLPNLFTLLLAWIFLSDGASTNPDEMLKFVVVEL